MHRGPHRTPRHRSPSHTVVLGWLAILLVLPVIAGIRSGSGLVASCIFGGAALMSLITFFSYRGDKKAAQEGHWRTPELTLHLLGLAGGWPGALLAQHVFRHKTAKASFLVVHWGTVALHQFAALDSLQSWKTSLHLWKTIRSYLAQA